MRRFEGRVPIVIAPATAEDARRTGIDESLVQFADGTRRRSATLLLQEYLNAHQTALWGLASDGLTLRLMRDNISLTRPAWIEADLAKIFSDGLFPDFAALWLLIHQSRFGAAGAAISDCPLERWRERGRTEGTAAREKLRLGVEAALEELGQGFIEHPANTALRQALTGGELTPQAYFEQLLRLVYRLIFLFAAEDRNLLHPDAATAAARRVYAEGYGVARLRERCMRRTAWDQHTDAFEGLKATFKALSRGEPRLGLPALGGLFAHDLTRPRPRPHPAIANRRLLAAIWRLAWLRPEGQPLTRVNWRDMQTEELGSVYEGLLELTPRASADARTFAFAEGDETKGHARKTTGSYYTPEALVKLLLDATLDPVLDAAEARNPADPVAEILKLSILDPACGSGHFLLGSARRAAARIAKLRSPGAPSQIEFQHALREVVSRCIHGVDRNPLAVELCKVALWIEALEPGKPLTFLDARIRCGDSLIGVFDYDMLRQGIPDEAYKPLTGDDKDAARAWGKLNRGQRDGKAKHGMLAEIRPPAALLDQARASNRCPRTRSSRSPPRGPRSPACTPAAGCTSRPHVEHPVQTVLDVPVGAHYLGKARRGERRGEEIVAGGGRGIAVDLARRGHLADRLEACEPVACGQPGDIVHYLRPASRCAVVAVRGGEAIAGRASDRPAAAAPLPAAPARWP